MRFFVIGALSLMLAACAGKLDYVRPQARPEASANVKIIDRPREAVWTSSIPELGKKIFGVNTIDKSSGLLNITYTGNPEEFIDCGRITSYVSNARGERTYDFPAAKAQQSYEIMEQGGSLVFVDRRMSLEGKINLIFEEAGPTSTRVTVNTRYVVTKTATVRYATNNFPQTTVESIVFNTGGGSMFPLQTVCLATGALEREVLSAIK
ncbi:hypothetical protein [Hylemonella gracilis]|uniref:hypothetical protein n=1 Tax=Hylemonella gracilis TaxID=80880 RepID=UPI0011100F68|nr:hypothetical protein [Hylemonella gracilis]